MPSLLTPPTSPVLSGVQPLKPAEPEQKRRAFGDSAAARQAVFDQTLAAAKSIKPRTNARHTLELADVDYTGPDRYTLAEQKAAILEGRSLGRKLRGIWRLKDNTTGAVLDEKPATLATVPYMTDRGTFINNGVEYTVSNQMRLRPGVFSRVKNNGEIEAHVNVLPGEGRSHRYHLDPAKSVFYANVDQAKIPLLPLLRAMGADDKQLREAWGPDILAANLQNDNPAQLAKFFEKFLPKDSHDKDDLDKKKLLIDVMSNMRTNPEVMKRTLGKPYSGLTLDAVLDTTKKLLAISRREADVDDRDHLAFQTVHGPEDMFAERLAKDYGGLQRALFQRASWSGSLKHITPGVLNKQLQAVLLHSGLGQSLEEINPADVFDKQSRISRLGEGGIPSIEAVPDEARSVQPSHLAFMDPIRTPESFKVGVDVHIARSAMKGPDGQIYSPFTDRRTGETVYKSPQDVADLTVAFPIEMSKPGKRAWAMSGGKIRWAKKDEVDLVVPQMENAFSPLGNMIPFKSATKGQRVAMGSRFITQALPLSQPESPLVQAGVPDEPGNSYEALYGKYMGAMQAKGPGRVMAVNPDSIQVRYADGTTESHELYQNFPYNRKTYIHQTPTVKPGDTVQAGQTIARSNYTNDRGETALGLNARVAYLPYQGKNFEDAVVISQSMAKRLSSEHMYQHRLDKSSDHKLGRGSFISLFPSKFNRRQLQSIDKNGIVQVGTEVHEGDPLILGAVAEAPARNKVHRRGGKSFKDSSVVWEHDAPGVVTDIVDTDKGITVLVKSVNEMQVGDKLSGRYGDKGVVADIIADDQMPHDKQGRPFEILLNPNGTISRTNPSQYAEAALGKIAAMTGEPFRISDRGFEGHNDLVEYAQRELAKHNLTDTEDVIDPVTGRKLKDADGNMPMAGTRFFMKLHHTAEGKGAGRGTGGYTLEETPAKGGPLGSKRISMMDINALMSHGATEVMRDVGLVRGQSNPDFWLAYQQGHNPPDPGIPHVYQKFVASLKGAGINVVPDANGTHIMAMTNKDVETLAGDREITSGDTVNFDKGLEPVTGGLFDPKLTGGHHGNRWSFIKLAEPMPNPVMEEPIRRILGLTQDKFEKVLSGKEQIQIGEVTATGPEGIKHALSSLNLDRELLRTREEIKHGKKTVRDQAIRKLGYLKTAKRLGMSLDEWMLDRVPVLPPKFRPLAVMSDSKLPLVSDANFLYKELLDANKNLLEMKDEVDDVGEERLATYQAFKAVTGLADPLHPKLQEKQVKGILQHIFGSSPKFGTVQRRLLSSTVDLVGRGVITPNPDLDMDSVGLPESRAWDVYEPFVVRRLRRKGLPLAQAKLAVQNRDPAARRELLSEMDHRPVFINRAPVLHRFGIMAFRPQLTKSETVQFSPLIVKGFGADFDGDAVQYHVPVREAAVREALDRMLPSRNLLSPADFKTPMHMPGQEYVGGLYEATAKSQNQMRPHRFASRRDAVRAFMSGEISIGTPVEIDE